MKKLIIIIIVLCTTLASKAQMPVINSQPEDATICSNGGMATFSITASNSPTTYSWEYSNDGGEVWKTIQGSITKFKFTNFQTANLQIEMNAFSLLRADSMLLLFRGYAINGSGKSVASTVAMLKAIKSPEKPVILKTDATPLCPNKNVQLAATPANGTWLSQSNSIATVTCCGLATTKAKGNAYIKYSYEATNGCATSAVYTLSVNANPLIPTIRYAAGSINPQVGAGGGGNFCSNRTFTVVGNPVGGVWSSSNTGALTVSGAGVVNTVGAGSAALTYTYTDNNGCSSLRTITGNVVLCASRGIANEYLTTNDAQWALFPNPTKGMVNIYVEKLIGAGTIVITDLYGKQIKSQALSMGQNRVDINCLSNGLYLVTVATNDGRTTKKLVVE